MARPARRPGNMPAETTSFIGRRQQIAEVRKKLTEARLVTLVGPGGVGKTRLAIRVAADLSRGFGDGGWLVELADVRDASLVSHVVMAALDLRDQAAADPLTLLLSHLRDKELLLVVDNCEHLLEAAARVVAEVLRTAPGIRVITTSREPLSVPGEHVVPVPPLALPVPQATEPLAQLSQNEAVMLFTQRAAAASGTFELSHVNQAAVVDLCRRLDGLPLAIELAAVRTRVLTVEQILDRLADRFGLLTGGSRAAVPRHQTLRTTIEWSHDMLPAGERAVLRRSAAFAGMFTLEDAEAVCGGVDAPAEQALDLVSSLVDKSLLVKEDVSGVACYRQHETMREFSHLKLVDAGEEESAELRCADYYRSKCHGSGLEGRRRLPEWLAWVDLEIDNLREVLRRCLSRMDTARGTDIAVSLGWYWITRATTEGTRWLEQFLAAGEVDQQARAWAYFIRGFLAVLKADQAAARPALNAAVREARQAGQFDLLSEALSMASIAENMAGDRASARRLLDEAVGMAGFCGQPAVLQARALNGFFTADLDAVTAAATEGVRFTRETGDLYSLENMLLNLGIAALMTRDLERSKPLLAEALQIAHRIDDRVIQAHLLDAFGYYAALRGQAGLTARLLGAAQTMRAQAGANVMPFIAPLLTKAEQSAREKLGAAKFEAESAAGRLLNRNTAAELALGKDPAGERPRTGTDAGVLGKREADVARLIADGLTNKQIGARLFIAERTVDSHVRAILNKLGFSSRAQIAAWMAAFRDLSRNYRSASAERLRESQIRESRPVFHAAPVRQVPLDPRHGLLGGYSAAHLRIECADEALRTVVVNRPSAAYYASCPHSQQASGEPDIVSGCTVRGQRG
jgi:predicted ATPase/DNA-binding CsgD family transcriptional regulator